MICSTPAFVLKSYDVRETSQIAIFFTRDFGKIKGILKGIRKDPEKFSTTLSLLSLNHIIFYQKRNSEIHLISQCDLLDDFNLRGSELKTFAISNQVAELVDILMPLEDKHRDVFELIFDFLSFLERSRQDIQLIFQIKILALSGFKPHFDSCLVCGCRVSSGFFFSHARGGLLCSKCVYQDQQAESILPGTIASILYIERSSWQRCLQLNISQTLRKQLEEILDCFIQFHIGRNLKTTALIHEFQSLP